MIRSKPVAVIDIGSNSVRLVVYSGPPRIPSPIFNEKVLAGLARGIGKTGMISEKAADKALAALRRFRLLIDAMAVGKVHVLATAAARDAANGPQFIADVKKLGLPCTVLSAGEEARLAGEGVVSGIPDADGMAGDLGGGSLELVAIDRGTIGDGLSIPLGVLRVAADPASEDDARAMIRGALKDAGLKKQARGRTLYLVGGSWRALARLDMATTDFPLPITHQYRFEPQRVRALRKLIAADNPILDLAIPQRQETAGIAAMLLDVLCGELEPDGVMVSAFGVREGLLHSKLSKAAASADPLIEAARDLGGRDDRFDQHGDALDRWLAPAFDDPPRLARLRLAACLLADVAFKANPFFRAERAIEMALHGDWVAIDAAGRVMIAEALAASFGRGDLLGLDYDRLCKPADLRRAREWGVAMRLGQRLSGGVGRILHDTALSRRGDTIELRIPERQANLANDAIQRRLVRLGEATGLGTEIRNH